MASPNDRVYSKTHEWHKLDGSVLTLGLTKFAVDQLTDVTYVQMKPPGTRFNAGDAIGEVESVKTTSDVYCAAAGEVVEVNRELESNPGLVNADPYGKGWLAKVRVRDASALDGLMKQAQYDAEYAS